MSSIKFSSTIVQPPAPCPNWGALGDLPLIYLGWGKRHFQSDPIPISEHPGWPYLSILRGECEVRLRESTLSLKEGDIFVAHPECALGWSSKSSAPCELLAFIWRTAPHPSLAISKERLLQGKATKEELQELRRIHQACRDEVAIRREFVYESVESLYRAMEVVYLRAMNRQVSHGSKRDQILFETAVKWMNSHLSLDHTLVDLKNFLEVSTLKFAQLFREFTRSTPDVYFQTLRMREAIRLKEEKGLSQKEVAFHLGYRHANDLSRALKKFSARKK